MSDDLREKVGRVARETTEAIPYDNHMTLEQIDMHVGTAVLAVVDVDGLRFWARRWQEACEEQEFRADAAVRDLAALRAGVEALTESYVQNDEGDIAPEDGWRFVRDLRDLLADPEAEQ